MKFWCATASDKAVKYFVCFVCMDVIGQWTSVSVYLCRTDRLLNRTHTHLSAICLHLFHIVRLLRLCFVVVFIFRLHSCFEPYFLIYSNLVVLLYCVATIKYWLQTLVNWLIRIQSPGRHSILFIAFVGFVCVYFCPDVKIHSATYNNRLYGISLKCHII